MAYGAVINATERSCCLAGGRMLRLNKKNTDPKGLIGSLRNVGVKNIVVIADEHDQGLRQTLQTEEIVIISDSDCDSHTQLNSVRPGIRQLITECDHLFLCPVGTPPITTDTLHEMMSRSADIILPVRNGKVCDPLLLSFTAARWYLLYNGAHGLLGAWKSLEKSGLASVKYVDIREPKLSETSPCYANLTHKAIINWV